jgi:hypothetical protein
MDLFYIYFKIDSIYYYKYKYIDEYQTKWELVRITEQL